MTDTSGYGYDDGERVVGIEDLTGRHLQVVLLVAEGMSDKQIAGKLGCSVSTAKNHVKIIYRVLGLDGQEAHNKRVLLARKVLIEGWL